MAHTLSQKANEASDFRVSPNLWGCTALFCWALRSETSPDGPQHLARDSPSDKYWCRYYGALRIDSRTSALDSPMRPGSATYFGPHSLACPAQQYSPADKWSAIATYCMQPMFDWA